MRSFVTRRSALNLALANAVFELVTTGVLPEALMWWVVRQLAEVDAAVASGLRPEVRMLFPTEEPVLTNEPDQRIGARIAQPLLHTLTVALHTLATADGEEAHASARWSVLEQLAQINAEVAAGLIPGVLGQQVLVGQET